MDIPKPAVRGRYSIRNPVANFFFVILDALLSVFVRLRPSPAQKNESRRILISNIAHLGDVIMATSMLPVIKTAYPQAQIGFLVGSWSKILLQNHPLVDEVHILDHWAHNRANISKWKKLQRYLQMRRQVLQEIRAADYDMAIDFYWNFPNTLPLLWQAGIPMRIGYESGGFGPLATRCLEFGDKRLSAPRRFLDLLKVLPLDEGLISDSGRLLRPVLPPVDASEAGVAAWNAALDAAGLREKEYVVFHVGAADSFRDWPSPRWRELANSLAAEALPLVFTGTGAADEVRIREITDGLSGCVNMCSRLTWSGFVAAVAGARLLVCVDTVAGHVAAATETPCVVLTAGRWPYLWRPLGQDVRVLIHPVPCAPCHRNSGCAGMECLREVPVSAAAEAVRDFLNDCEQSVPGV